MKKLEEIIRKNQRSFDSEEPSANHFEKFLKKLDERQIHLKRDKTIKLLTHIASTAAVILLVVSIVLLGKTSDSGKKVTFQLPAEIMEIDIFFQRQIDKNFETLSSRIRSCPVQKKNLHSCFKELDKSLEFIRNDLIENPGNERVIHALVNHYQTKLEIMDQFMKQSNKNCI